ncbi:hypothetical protein XENOCAPTIV_005940, partial [Xenoophorus captivus]
YLTTDGYDGIYDCSSTTRSTEDAPVPAVDPLSPVVCMASPQQKANDNHCLYVGSQPLAGTRTVVPRFANRNGTSVSVSTFNLVAIALERYNAICRPLSSLQWQTRSHAYRVISVTWLLAFIIMIPYPIISNLRSFKRLDNTTAHQCRHKWPLAAAEQTW